jgi:hypothetical protein
MARLLRLKRIGLMLGTVPVVLQHTVSMLFRTPPGNPLQGEPAGNWFLCW